MATPNLTSISSIIPNQVNIGLGTTAMVGILTNISESNKVYKIDNIRITAISGIASDSTITVGYSTVGSATTNYLASDILVPSGSALIVSDRDSGVYLLENTHLVASTNLSNSLDVLVKFEELS